MNPAASAGPTVDSETGEVKTDADGKEIDAWDKGKTALDPLGQIFQQVYGNGWLVTVDEATRIKPLTIPVKVTLLGQQSERTVGALKQKQSFTLQVLDDKVDKAIEKCRKVTDVMELLTYPLSQGNRWLPEAAKGLLEKELESRNEQGKKALRDALGGDNITAEGAKSLLMKQFESPNEEVKRAIQDALGGDTIKPEVAKSLVEKILVGKELKKGDEQVQKALRDALLDGFVAQFIATRTDSIREDLNGMYRQLAQGDAVPKDKLKSILDEVEHRLKHKSTSTTAPPRGNFRKTLARLLKDSIRLGERRHELGDPETYGRRKAKLHQRLDMLIDSSFDDADAKRLLTCGAIARRCSPFSTTARSVPTTTTPKNRCARPSSPARSVNRTAPRTAPRPTPS